MNLMSNHFIADWDADWFQSIVMHGIVYAKAANFVQSANKIAILLFGFPP